MSDGRIDFIKNQLEKTIQEQNYSEVLSIYHKIIKYSSMQQQRIFSSDISSLGSLRAAPNTKTQVIPKLSVHQEPFSDLILAIKPAITELAVNLQNAISKALMKVDNPALDSLGVGLLFLFHKVPDGVSKLRNCRMHVRNLQPMHYVDAITIINTFIHIEKYINEKLGDSDVRPRFRHNDVHYLYQEIRRNFQDERSALREDMLLGRR